MKKTLLASILTSVIALLLLCISIMLQECNNVEDMPQDTDEYFDMGTGIYREPFVGIFSSRPDILVWSLDIPPYKYFVDDTLRFTRTFNIEFNEESLRYYKQIGQESTIKFTPQTSVHYTPSSIKVAATEKLVQFSTTCTVDPKLGDTITTTKMELYNAAVDEVDTKQVTSGGYVNIKNCRAVQYIDKPWALWYLWILTILLPIIIIILCILGRTKK